MREKYWINSNSFDLSEYNTKYEYIMLDERTFKEFIFNFGNQDYITEFIYKYNDDDILVKVEEYSNRIIDGTRKLKNELIYYPRTINSINKGTQLSKLDIEIDKNTIRINKLNDLNLMIFDIHGKQIVQTLNQNVIDISRLSHGAYFLVFNSKGRLNTKKFIKE